MTADVASPAPFEGSELGASTEFEGSELGASTEFEGSELGASTEFEGSELGASTELEGFEFGASTEFEGSELGASTEFEASELGTSTEFEGSELGASTEFESNESGAMTESRAEEAAAASTELEVSADELQSGVGQNETVVELAEVAEVSAEGASEPESSEPVESELSEGFDDGIEAPLVDGVDPESNDLEEVELVMGDDAAYATDAAYASEAAIDPESGGEAVAQDDAADALPSERPEDREFVAPDVRNHILESDATGGGHRFGTGKPGKSEFPESWSDDTIIERIEDIANDPNSARQPGRNGATIVQGSYDGIDIEVILSAGGEIRTGYPTNVPRNPRR